MAWRWYLAITIALMASRLTIPALAQDKFGVVDLQKALNESKLGKETKEAFGKKVESAQKVIDAKEQELRMLQTEFEKQSVLLSAEAKVEKTRDFEAKRRDLERFIQDSRQELSLEERRLTNKILEEIEKVVQQLGESEGYTFVFERNQSGLLHAKKGIDLTDKVIRLYDTKQKR